MTMFFFKQKTAYEISTRDWSSDVCSSDLLRVVEHGTHLCALRVRAQTGNGRPVTEATVPHGSRIGGAEFTRNGRRRVGLADGPAVLLDRHSGRAQHQCENKSAGSHRMQLSKHVANRRRLAIDAPR